MLSAINMTLVADKYAIVLAQAHQAGRLRQEGQELNLNYASQYVLLPFDFHAAKRG